MNQPSRYELFVLPEGVKKVTVEKDLKILNAAKFIVQREDHTLGNVLRERLAMQANVTFAAYRVPHHLKPVFELVVHTNKASTPVAALSVAIDDLLPDLSILEDRFKLEVNRVGRHSAPQSGAMY